MASYTPGDDIDCFKMNKKFEEYVFKLYVEGVNYDRAAYDAATNFQLCLATDPNQTEYLAVMNLKVDMVDNEMTDLNA